MTDYGHWTPPNGITEIPSNTIGFVYIITTNTGKKYVGKKLLEFKKSRPPLKGNKNKRRYKVPSDWKDYTGSSPILNEYIEKNGKSGFKFEIISFHPSKMTLSYYETKEIVDRNAIFDKTYYNEILNCRFRNKKS